MDALKNFAAGQVLNAPFPAATGTSLVLKPGQGALFPAPPFNCTVWPAQSMATAQNAEVIRVTAIVGDSITILRQQEGSAARNIQVGDQVAQTITAGLLSSITGGAIVSDIDPAGVPSSGEGTFGWNRVLSSLWIYDAIHGWTKLIGCILMLMSLSAMGQTGVPGIIRNFATTNTPSDLTNIIASMTVNPTNGVTSLQVTNIAQALDSGPTNYTIQATNDLASYARLLNSQGTNNTTQATNDLNTLLSAETNILAGYSRTLNSQGTNNTTQATNDLNTLLSADTNILAGYSRTLNSQGTNNTTQATNDLATVVKTYTNIPLLSTSGNGINLSTNGNTVTIATFLGAFDSSIVLSTNAGQVLIKSTSGGSGTGIQTNGGSGTNNILVGPTMTGAPGSVDSNILYVVYGITNWVFRTNGDLVNLGPGSLYGLIASGAATNAAGSRVVYLGDINNATNDLSGVLKTYTQNATNDLSGVLKTYTQNATNDLNTLVKTYTNVPLFVTQGNGIGMSTNGNTVTVATRIQATDSSIVITTNSGVLSIQSTAGGSGTGIQTNNGTGTNNAFTTAKFLSVPGVQLANFTDSLYTQSTNWMMDSIGGSKMQRVFNGTTNGFRSVINARDYGLSSAGGDQTANLQAAITAATNSGLFAVYIPPSTNVYTINGLILPAGVRLFSDSTRGTVGTGRGATLYANNAGKPMIVPSGANIEIDHISFLDDGGQFGGIGILITNESNVVQDYSIHDCTFKGLAKGIYVHYSWGGNFVNNMFIGNTGFGIQASNNVNALNIEHNYFSCTNGLYVQGDSNYGWHIHGANEFEAGAANMTTSNGVFMTGINQGFYITGNYFEKITNCVVVNGSYGTTIAGNTFINCPNGTNIWIVGASFPSVIGNKATDQFPFISVDNTTYGLTYLANDVRSSAAVQLNPINMYANDTTNVVLKSSGAYYGKSALTNATGSADAFLSDLVNATNETTLRVNGANIDGAINGQVITGAVSFVQFDASCFMTNSSYNSNALAYVNMGATSTSLQGSDTASPLLLYPLSSIKVGAGNNIGTNRFFLQWYPPPSWNGAAVNLSINTLCATNTITTGGSTNITFAVSGAASGAAQPTPATATGTCSGTGFISTNINVGPFTIGGSPAANTPVIFQVDYRSQNADNGRITNNAWVLGCRLWYTNSATQNALVTGW